VAKDVAGPWPHHCAEEDVFSSLESDTSPCNDDPHHLEAVD
jgi:hypothetical protein